METGRNTMERAYGLSMVLLAIIASGIAALGQTPAKTAQDEIAKTVSVLDHVWLDAAHNHDAETLNWLFADNFVEIHPGGEIVDKAKQIAQVSDPKVPIQELHPD